RAEDKGIDIEVRASSNLPYVEVDADRLNNAMRNLLDNALAHTERGGKITLAAHTADDTVDLTVTDTGLGIPRQHLPRIFEKFFRVPGQQRDGGTGLGLAIVQEIVNGHGGTVTCDSEPGLGTTFSIRLAATSVPKQHQSPTAK